ncbi:MAG: NYN domain-containing protein [Pirellulaceae bacterium]
MSLLIDGYNLLHASGVLPRGAGAGTLERARGALLEFLVSALDPQELRQTTIVFDAKDAPKGVPDAYDYQGLSIRFARDYRDADVLLIELIRLDHAPRKLVVVSSDHQVQRAARRRRAKAVDSDVWCSALIRQGRRFELPGEQPETKPAAPLPQSEVQRWMREFGDVDMRLPEKEELPRVSSEPDVSPEAQETSATPAAENEERDDAPVDPLVDDPLVDDPLVDEAKRLAAEDRALANPFPPGYAEDLLDDDDDDDDDEL